MVNSPNTSAFNLRRSLASGTVFLVIGALGYKHIASALQNNVFPFGALLAFISSFLCFDIIRGGARHKWLWTVVPIASCLVLDSITATSGQELMQNPTREVAYQFGFAAIGFFAVIFLWILFAPTNGFRAASRRRLLFRVAFIAVVAQSILAFQFLRELTSATSPDQIRSAERRLLYTALDLYLFQIVKMFLPNEVTGADVPADLRV